MTCDSCRVKQRLIEETEISTDDLEGIRFVNDAIEEIEGLLEAVGKLSDLSPSDVSWNDEENQIVVESNGRLGFGDDGNLKAVIVLSQDRVEDPSYAKTPWDDDD